MEFNKVVKAIGDSGPRLILDRIIKDILEKHEEELIKTSKCDFSISPEEVETTFAAWVEKRNESYNRRVYKSIGKLIPDEWNTSVDIACIRKRMLNRSLLKTKEDFQVRLVEHRLASKTKYLEVLLLANNKLNDFNKRMKALFPMPAEELEISILLNRETIMKEIKAVAPNIDQLALWFHDITVTDPLMCWFAFTSHMKSNEAALMDENTSCTDDFVRL